VAGQNLKEYSPDCRRVENVISVSGGRPGVFHSDGFGDRFELVSVQGRTGTFGDATLEGAVIEVIWDTWKLEKDVILGYHTGGINGKRVSFRDRFAIAWTHDGKEIAATGMKFWKGMKTTDLLSGPISC
jgi:hypothetical protein